MYGSAPEKLIKVILADDHEVVRVGMRRLLGIDKSFIVLGEAENGKQAVEMVQQHKPDIVLLDILMPVMDGIKAADIIKKTVPETYVVILTAFEDLNHVERALASGANGYLTKDIIAKDLAEALKTVLHGERAFSKSILRLLENKYSSQQNTDDSEFVIISKREQEVLDLVAQGRTSQEIAEQLFISIRTVQSHRSNIMTKLGVRNTAGLVRYAVSTPIIIK